MTVFSDGLRAYFQEVVNFQGFLFGTINGRAQFQVHAPTRRAFSLIVNGTKDPSRCVETEAIRAQHYSNLNNSVKLGLFSKPEPLSVGFFLAELTPPDSSDLLYRRPKK